jgi:hypothetical protein
MDLAPGSDPLPADFDATADASRKLLALRGTIDEVLLLARSRGYSKIQCCLLLQAVVPTTPAQVKDWVHDSPIWADRKESDDRLLDILRRIQA